MEFVVFMCALHGVFLLTAKTFLGVIEPDFEPWKLADALKSCFADKATLDKHGFFETSLDLYYANLENGVCNARCNAMVDLYCSLRFLLKSGSVSQLRNANLRAFPDVDLSLTSPYVLANVPSSVLEIIDSSLLAQSADAASLDVHRRFPCGKAGCVGVWLFNDGKCKTCDTTYCNECFEPKAADHVCDEANKATALEVRQSTRACPKCTAPVHRREGCPQMMCVVCHCMFNYDTGALITKRDALHNPHYMALSATAKAAVQAQVNSTEAGSSSAHADAEGNDLRCMTPGEFHLEVRNRLEANARAGTKDAAFRFSVYALVDVFEHLQVKTTRGAARAVDSEVHDRIARVSLLTGKALPVLTPALEKTTRFAVRNYENRASLLGVNAWDRLFDPFAPPQKYSKPDFIRQASYTLTGRMRRAQNTARNQSICDAARDMLVTYITSRDQSVRTSILKALDTLSRDAKKGAVRAEAVQVVVDDSDDDSDDV